MRYRFIVMWSVEGVRQFEVFVAFTEANNFMAKLEKKGFEAGLYEHKQWM